MAGNHVSPSLKSLEHGHLWFPTSTCSSWNISNSQRPVLDLETPIRPFTVVVWSCVCYMTGPPLKLYLLRSEDVLANNFKHLQSYNYNSNSSGSEQILSQIINLTPFAALEGPNPVTTLRVTVIIHEIAHCKDTPTDLASKSPQARYVRLPLVVCSSNWLTYV